MGCASSSRVQQITVGPVPTVRTYNTTDAPNVNTTDFILTDRQKYLIKQTWQRVTNKKQQLGQLTFLNIFRLCPHIKTMFDFRDLSDGELLNDAGFVGHAERFMQVIESAVLGLDNLDHVISPVMRNLGRMHIRKASLLRSELLDVFVLGMMNGLEELMHDQREAGSGAAGGGGEVEEEEEFYEGAQEAWILMLCGMIRNMKDGYELASSQTVIVTMEENGGEKEEEEGEDEEEED